MHGDTECDTHKCDGSTTNGDGPARPQSETTGDAAKPKQGGGRRQVVTAKRLLEQLEKQEFRCYFTGDSLSPETASVEHLQPLSKGGQTEIGNVVWVRKEVNIAKGSLSESDFIRLCNAVADGPAANRRPTRGA